MARARGIKPGFFRNADLVELSFEVRLLFIGLWTLADREGRMEDRPKQIKMDIFPADDVDCSGMLDQLAATGMLTRYESGGKRYLQVVNFTKHQNPHRDERPSTIPAPGEVAGKTGEMQQQNNISTVQAQCEHGIDTVQIGLTPDSGLLTPDSRPLIPDSPTETHTPSLPRESASPPTGATMAGAVCVVLRSEGVGSVNPSHPDLLVLLAGGATVGQFSEAAKLAVGKKKATFAYVLGIVKKQLQDVAELSKPPPPGQQQAGYETPYQRTMRERVAAFAPGVARKAPTQHPPISAPSENRNVIVN